MQDQLINITQASHLYNITRQAIFVAIKQNRLKAFKIGTKWFFHDSDWNNYVNSKYDRRFSSRNGLKLYDETLGILSPSMAANMLGVSVQSLYYHMRKGILPFQKNGGVCVLKKDDVIENKDRLCKKRKPNNVYFKISND